MTSYEAALDAFRRTCDAWQGAGQPQSGPLLDAITTAREQLVLAQPPDNGLAVVTALYRDRR